MSPVKRGSVTVIPEALTLWRRRRKLTQAALAARSGCSEALIGHAETGRRNLSSRSVHKIADALLVPVEAIAHANDTEIVPS